jgi:type IV pilus assembly protein PilV
MAMNFLPTITRTGFSKSLETGFGMIEVLMALLVIAVGLLGLAGLQGKSQLTEMESYQRAQALMLLEDMANRLRANRAGRDSYVLSNLGLDFVGTDSGFAGTGCADAQACWDLQQWQNELLGAAEIHNSNKAGAMSGARGCITGGGLDFLVTIAWQGVTADDYALTGNDPRITNTCGTGLYGNESQRQIVSIPVRFFDPQ